MCMEAKNKYSQIRYCPTSLLIVMLSARETEGIFFNSKHSYFLGYKPIFLKLSIRKE